MANLIDKTFFVGDLDVAQVSQANVEAELVAYITRLEPEYLNLLMGSALAAAFVAGIAGAPYLELAPVVKRGIACYVYFHYMRQKATVSTGTGEKVAKAANSIDATPYFKAARAWNEMVMFNRYFRDYAKVNYPLYTDPVTAYSPMYLTHDYSLTKKRRAMFHVINSSF